MLTLTKFICGCFGIGAVALLGMALLNTPGPHAQGSVANSGNAIVQSAAAELGSIYRQVSMEVGPRVRYMAVSSGAFMRGNLITAKYQFEGMRNTLAATLSIDALRSRPEPSWMQNGVQGARQVSAQKTLAMANAMPQVTAVKADLQHLADAHPALAAAGF
jgi:hypothetical protein